ncbi:MAG: ABC transporter permease [Firmicutes bacterium]|nr:ABC transporter permease [Bacillota bacterium]
MSRQLFTNTSTLASLIRRRDRIQVPIWIVSIVVISLAIALAFPGLYPPGPERQIIALTLENPAMVSMIGPNYGFHDYHVGAIMAHQMLLFTTLAVAIMNILLTIRHTRRDEEHGRIEVIRSLPVGRLSNAASVMLALTITNLSLGLLTAVGLGSLGLEGMDWTGSLLYGAVLTASGIFFAAVTLLFAQLTETSRAAMGYSFSFLGLAFLLRAIGDISSEPLALISPLGLVLRTQVFVNDYWWPILIVLLAAGLITLGAFKLNTIRDLGAGLVAARPGRNRASRFLQSPLGLVWRLEKTTIIGWAVGMFVLGVSYGSVFSDVENFFQTSELIQQMLPNIEGFSITDQFLAMLLAVMSMFGAIPALLVTLRLRAEERAHRTEHLLSRAVSRLQLMASFLGLASVVAIVMQVLNVLGLWITAGSVMANPFPLGKTLEAALAYIPAMWILIAVAAVLIAFTPKLAGFTWLYLGYTFFTGYFGGILQLPDWMVKLTPWGHIPSVPMEQISIGTILGILFVAGGLVALSLYGYRKRDIYG